MKDFDIAIAWEWYYDREFIDRLNNTLINKGLSSYLISPYNVEETMTKLKEGKIRFRSFLDRASDADERFIPLADFLSKRKNCLVVNTYKNSRWAQDKATMHLELLEEGVRLPYTVIVSPFDHEPFLTLDNLEHLGRPFIVKPANGGGGIGVVTGAETLHDVFEARKCHADDKFLLQEKMYPEFLDGRRAWFRILCVFGKTIPCWWDDQTKVYTYLDIEEEREYKLKKLRIIARKVAKICKLNFF
ncbi:hypothetical protein KKC59_04095, partial [bacterium]|nr:hypothetical protein [bacterium]